MKNYEKIIEKTKKMRVERGVEMTPDIDWETPILNYEGVREYRKCKNMKKVSDILGLGYSKLRTVIRNWNNEGVKSIFSIKKPKKNDKLTEEQKEMVGVHWVAYAEYTNKKTSLLEIQMLLKDRGIVDMNDPRSVQRTLRRLRLKTDGFKEDDVNEAISLLEGTGDQREIKAIHESLEKIKDDPKFEMRWEAIREILLSDNPNKSEIGKKHGLGRSMLHHYLNRYLRFGLLGLIDKKAGPKHRYITTIKREVEVVREWEKGMYGKEISKNINMNLRTVREVLKKYKLKRTTKKFAVIKEEVMGQRRAYYTAPVSADPHENNYIDKEFVQWVDELKKESCPICMPGFLIMAPVIDRIGMQNWVRHLGILKQDGFGMFHILLVDIGRKILGLETIENLDTCTDKGLAVGCGLSRVPRSTTERINLRRITEEHAKKLNLTLGREVIESGLSDGANIAFDFKLLPYTGSDKDVKERKGMAHSTTMGKMRYGDLALIAYDFENNVPVIGKRYDGKARGKSVICEFIDEIYEPGVGIGKLKLALADAEFPSLEVLDYLDRKGIEGIMAYASSEKTKELIDAFSDEFQTLEGTKKKYFMMRLEINKKLTKYTLICVKKSNKDTSLFVTTRKLFSIKSGEERMQNVKEILETYRKRSKIEVEIKDEIWSFFIDRRPSNDETIMELHIFTTLFADIAYKLFRREVGETIGSKTVKTMRNILFTAKNVKLYCRDNKLVMKFIDEFTDREQTRILMAVKEFLDKEGGSIPNSACFRE